MGKKGHFSLFYLSSLAVRTLWETTPKPKLSHRAAPSVCKSFQKDLLLHLTRVCREAGLFN